jgi:hypothetical protein
MKTYPLSPSGFTALRAKLLELGVTLPSDSEGTVSYRGIELKYSYDAPELTLTVEKKPFFVPASLIWENVDEWMAGLV